MTILLCLALQVPTFEEKKLWTVPDGIEIQGTMFSTALDRAASIGKKGEAWVAVIDGQAGEEFDQVFPPMFSVDGRRVAYTAQRGDRWIAIVDGVKSEEFPEILPPVFSLDGKSVAWIARSGPEQFLVVDGKKMGPYEGVKNPEFFEDGRLGFVARDKGRDRYILQGAPGEEFDRITDSVVRGNRLALAVQIGKRACVVVDGIKGGEFPFVGRPVFSRDGKQVAYAAGKTLVVDGRTIETPYSNITGIVFGPRGPAYIGDGRVAVIDGKPSEPFDRVDWIRFSPDGERWAFAARNGRKEFAVIDGRRGEEFDRVWPPFFSSDGKRFAHVARTGRNYFAVVDGKRGDPYAEISDLTFSPDGRRTAMLAQKDGRFFVVSETLRGEACDEIQWLCFDGEGRRLAYGARQGRDLWRRILKFD
jgi:hypothetical protein